jgi:UBX domain-containing protein 7
MFRKEGWTQVNPLRPEQFAELAADFCSRHSFDKAPIAPLSSHVPTTTNSGNRSSNMFQNPDNMTEEEQLQAALQASMGDTMVQEQNQQDAYDSDDSDVYILENDDDSVVDHPHDTNVSMDSSLKLPSKTTDTTSAPPSSSPQKTLSFWDDILSIKVEEEPSATNNVARIMIRMPDGKRLVRKFDNHGTVKDIYAFVAQSYPDFKSRNKEFEMMVGFPPKDLMTCVDESIASAGLAGESITVRWKD